MFALITSRAKKLTLALVAVLAGLFVVSCGANYDKPITAQDECPSQADLLEAEERVEALKSESDYIPRYMNRQEYISFVGGTPIYCQLEMVDVRDLEQGYWYVEFEQWRNNSDYYQVSSLADQFDSICEALNERTNIDNVQDMHMIESAFDSILLGIYALNPNRIYEGVSCDNGAVVKPTVDQSYKQSEAFKVFREEASKFTEDNIAGMGVPDEIKEKYL